MAREQFNPDKKLQAVDLEKLEFDDWKELYESDPELFDRYRKKLLQHQIDMAPASIKPRLLGLMFQMEAEALRSPTPISYSMRLSAMMMDKFDELRQTLAHLTGVKANFDKAVQREPQSADIIPFESRPGEKNE